jgi:hypothetical protein
MPENVLQVFLADWNLLNRAYEFYGFYNCKFYTSDGWGCASFAQTLDRQNGERTVTYGPPQEPALTSLSVAATKA